MLTYQRLQIRKVEMVGSSYTHRFLQEMKAAGYASLGCVLPNLDTVHLSSIADYLNRDLELPMGRDLREKFIGPLRDWSSGGDRQAKILENMPRYMEREQ